MDNPIVKNAKLFHILDTIEKGNFEVWVVGGFVRNYLMGYPLGEDIDLTTNALPSQIISLFPSMAADLSGCHFLNVKLANIEITTYRHDTYDFKSRFPIAVRAADSFQEDVMRRDFTCNSIAMNKQNEIYDPLDGSQDIKSRLLRSVLAADISMQQDPLRILRGLRFLKTYQLQADSELSYAIEHHFCLLFNLANSQLLKELTRYPLLQTIQQLMINKQLLIEKEDLFYQAALSLLHKVQL